MKTGTYPIPKTQCFLFLTFENKMTYVLPRKHNRHFSLLLFEAVSQRLTLAPHRFVADSWL